MHPNDVFILVLVIGLPLLVMVWRVLAVIYQLDAKCNKLFLLTEHIEARGAEIRLHSLDAEAWWYTWNVPSYRCNAAGYNVKANRALCELFGMTESDMSGTGWAAAITDTEGKAEALQHWFDSRERDRPYRDSYEIKNQRTGVRVNCETFTVAAHNPNTKAIEGFVGVVWEV